MFYNFRFFPYLMLFMAGVYGLLNGWLIFRIKEVRIPFTYKKYFKGLFASIIGIVLILFGSFFLCLLVWSIYVKFQ